MTLTDKIQATELKIVALRKAANNLDAELAEIKKQARSKPAPSNKKKVVRMEKFAAFYMKKGIL